MISGKIQPRDYALVKCIADVLQLTNSVKKIHWLIYLDESEENTHRNLELFAEAISLMMIFPAEVRFHYAKTEKYLVGTPFPHIVISSKGMLMTERNCESACYLRYTEMVKRYRDYVKERYETAAKAAVFV